MSTKDNFNKLWSEQQDVSFIGKQMFKVDRKKIFSFLKFTNLVSKSEILDVGCGTGGTLKYIKNLGYDNSIGIDSSVSSLRLCEMNGFKRNKNVFLIDIIDGKFDKDFDLVFAEGVIEHYKDIQPVVHGMCKASRKYILTTMPNLKSKFWALFEFTLKAMGRFHAEDFQHDFEEYRSAFEKEGFRLKVWSNFSFNRGWIMLFERIDKNGSKK